MDFSKFDSSKNPRKNGRLPSRFSTTLIQLIQLIGFNYIALIRTQNCSVTNAPELSPDIGAAGPALLAADTAVTIPVVALAGTTLANNGPVVMFGATGVKYMT